VSGEAEVYPQRPAALRSWLFVPGDSERKQKKALASDADALIIDLEDSVDPLQLPAARARVRELLRSHTAGARPQLWVRVNPPTSDVCREDLAAIFASDAAGGIPDGLVVPKVSTAAEVATLSEQLTKLEGQRQVQRGHTRLLVLATETAQGLLGLGQFPAQLSASVAARIRLAGLTWGVEDLGAALGALAKRDANGELTFTFQLARSSCLLAAAALGVQAIDGVYVDFKDTQGLKLELRDSRRDGFSGKLAIHPDQVGPINAAFTPTAAERAHARRVIAAFTAAGGAGVASLDGQMIDRPHLVQALRILAAAGEGEGSM
jgi:citrate lyase subunit beta / citryl-CoA lyase